MKKKHPFLLSVAISLITTAGFAQQNIAINEDGSTPSPNAILDIKSFTKGMLIPRVSTSGRTAIPNTKGLLVYDTTTSSFWYNTGAAWQNMAAPTAASTSWLLTGNAINDPSNFIGTTDNIPFKIKVNNQPAGLITVSEGNTFWGYNAGAATTDNSGNTGIGRNALKSNISTPGQSGSNQKLNTAVGDNALPANTTGAGNVAIGANSLFHDSVGFGNTATGYSSMNSNISGFSNVANGNAALFSNTTGQQNTAMGSSSMYFTTTGIFNTAIGSSSMFHNASGSGNTAVGIYSLFLNTNGVSNTAIGKQSLFNHTSGDHNVAVGDSTLWNDVTGSFNTAIGSGATVPGGGLANATAIGAGAIVNASNKVRIGNSAVTVIEGQVPFTTPSDGRYKYDILEDVKGLDFVLKLRPVTYHFDVKRFDAQQGAGAANTAPVIQAAYDEAAAIRRSGFIAQEVETAADASGYDFSGIIKPKTVQEHYSLSYESFVVPLVKGMQEQQRIIDAQNKKIAQQDKQLADVRQQLEEIKQLIHHTK